MLSAFASSASTKLATTRTLVRVRNRVRVRVKARARARDPNPNPNPNLAAVTLRRISSDATPAALARPLMKLAWRDIQGDIGRYRGDVGEM